MNKPRIALTGVTGFIGSHLLDKLHLLNFSGTIFNRSEFSFKQEFKSVQVPNLADYDGFENGLSGIDVIIHCAARAHIMHDEVADPLEEYRRVNVEGTLNLARQGVAAGIKRFIYLSSIKVNGESNSLGSPFYESDSLSAKDFYGQSKAEAEKKLTELSQATGLEVVIIRPTLVYGPGVKANFAALMNLASKGIPLPFSCINQNKRSLVSVTNLVDLIITCIDHPKAANQVFLVSDNHDVSTSEMVREMAKALDKPTWQLPIPIWCYKLVGKLFDKSDVVDRLTGSLQVDISHTKETLGWTPPQTLQEGFKQTAQAFLQAKTK
ncbi:UDP-glucose 4-epimerase [Shewanella baltica OS183]|uniref:UDP-glucose 4-epimerase family protein n=1 Tax=Shewanella baltica TaxID=62322 RepID=UPI0001E10F50|nr:SDR family oxidoreductase [Shewanella baltica]EHQ15715.1 UDP-glucose 4-epimerase [Shewanella baltica OS183]